MKFKNSIGLITILVLTMLFAGCTGGNTNTTTATFQPYVGGTEGVNFEFMPGMPSDVAGTILDNKNSVFGIGIKLTNIGEHNINAGSLNDYLVLKVKGIQPSLFGLNSEEDLKMVLDEDLKGSTKNFDGTTIKGDFTILSVEDLSYQSDIQGDLPLNFLVDVCYDYSTKSQTRVCVADDVYEALRNENSKEICDVTLSQPTMNSGGPVHVKNLKQTPMGGSKINVFFDILKVGSGDIYAFESANDCSQETTNKDKNKVLVVVAMPEGSEAKIDCGDSFVQTNKGLEKVVTLADGMSQVSCKIETGNPDGNNIYFETLKVDLYYRYNDQIQKSLVIKDSGSAYD
ncbi:MAG: hypothetical protein AB7V77_03245 [Candidatus Woesearchaeota archaeon]